ncbi:MAG TPA: hypothetical protein VKB88_18955 [Bryobacteraceae bacterium]|nr:hypothetical protein [Bryobacteraceae bacterium]
MLHRFSAAPIATGLAVLLFAPFFQTAFAAGTPDPKQDQATISRFVSERLHIWQDRMNLKDWDIHVELVRADKLEPKTLGNIHWDTDVKQATIGVLSPLDYQLPYNAMLADMEVTIVHELVHLELASLPRSDASRRVEEHAVNEIAAALLRLSRR